MNAHEAVYTLNEYQDDAERTSNDAHLHSDARWEREILICGLGLAGEAGEAADYLKKVFGHGHPLDAAKMEKELGDVLWYIARLSRLMNVTLGQVALTNIKKLKERYPDGFSSKKSINRNSCE